MTPFARGLACADECEQAEFFNAFFRELDAACKAHNSSGEQQLYSATRHLDGPARRLVTEWAKAVEYEREQDRQRNAEHAVDRETFYKLQQEVRELQAKKEKLEDPFA